MLEFLFLILLLFIFIPLGSAIYRVWRLQRNMRDFMRDPAETARRAQPRAESGKNASGNPFTDFFASWGTRNSGQNGSRRTARRGKKIPRDVGEYVNFTEIKTESKGKSTATQQQYSREDQIQDIEWEEIK